MVAPLIGDVPHAAGLFGWGSDVLGYDTERSTDHGWGPRLSLFVEAGADELNARMDALPSQFRGWPVRYGWDAVEVRHHVSVSTIGDALEARLGFDPREHLTTRDWLLTPQQLLLELVSGTIFADPAGELGRVQSLVAWYPDDVWLWLIACQWVRISQEEAFVGRTAEVGDELGSRVVAARLTRELMRLWLLFHRRYAPYSKWLGTAFAEVDPDRRLTTPLERALTAGDHAERETGLAAAYEVVARRHNDLGFTDHVDPTTRPYHGRPYRVLHADRFVDACRARITNAELAGLPLVGSVDQFADSTDILSHRERPRRLGAVYDK